MLTPSIRAARWRRLAAALAGSLLLAACSGTPVATTATASKSEHPTLAQIMGEEPMTTDPWAANCYAGFERDILAIAGDAESFDCGFMRMDATDAQRADANRCAKVAVAAKRPFRVGHIDADGKTLACDVALRDVAGQLWRVFYDFDLHDAQSKGKSDGVLVASRCGSIAFRPGTGLHGSFFAMEDCQPVPAGVAAVPFSPGHAMR